jgi:hypothetical protein
MRCLSNFRPSRGQVTHDHSDMVSLFLDHSQDLRSCASRHALNPETSDVSVYVSARASR